MRKIGVFICSYNGRKYVIDCIQSLKKQSMQNFDIYVIDNASTDGTTAAIYEEFGDLVTVLQNSENLGGAGGFDRGLQHGIQAGYEFITLLDNDIILDEYAIENLYKHLIAHEDVGIVGAKVFFMDEPDKIMDFGSVINFQEYKMIFGYNGELDNSDVPETRECDYVPACAAMTRRSVLLECGTMPVDCFIYVDDIEMCYRMKCKGYKVIADAKARVWHKGGGSSRIANNTFGKYYNTRNTWNFFAKYMPEQQIEEFVDKIIHETFPVLYGCQHKGKKELYDTTWYIFHDFINNIRGKAQDGRINTLVSRPNPAFEIFKEKNCILIDLNSDGLCNLKQSDTKLMPLLCCIQSLNQAVEILFKVPCFNNKKSKLSTDDMYLKWDLKGVPQIFIAEKKDLEVVDLELQYCEHVTLVKQNVLPVVYWDKHFNFITNNDDFNYYTNYNNALESFKKLHREKAIQMIYSIREKNEKTLNGDNNRVIL